LGPSHSRPHRCYSREARGKVVPNLKVRLRLLPRQAGGCGAEQPPCFSSSGTSGIGIWAQGAVGLRRGGPASERRIPACFLICIGRTHSALPPEASATTEDGTRPAFAPPRWSKISLELSNLPTLPEPPHFDHRPLESPPCEMSAGPTEGRFFGFQTAFLVLRRPHSDDMGIPATRDFDLRRRVTNL
jgi:hypothetical protein